MRTPAAKNSRRQPTRKSPTPKISQLFRQTEIAPIESFIHNWAPSTGINLKTWAAIAPVTRSIISDIKPGSIEMARKYLRALARHIAARFIAGHQITNTELLLNDHALSQTYGQATQGKLKDSTKATELGFLYRIRQSLHPEIYQKSESLRFSGKELAEPYSIQELTALLAWSRQRSAARNIRIHGALLLSLACGLDGSEFSFVSGEDFYVTPWGLVVQANGMPKPANRCKRFVPVLAQYESETATLAKIAGAHPLVGLSENNNVFDVTKEQPRTFGVPNFNGNKARANWTQSLLINGASYVAMHQAGVSVAADKRLASLSTGIVTPFDQYVANIRGGDSKFDPQQFSFLAKYQGKN